MRLFEPIADSRVNFSICHDSMAKDASETCCVSTIFRRRRDLDIFVARGHDNSQSLSKNGRLV